MTTDTVSEAWLARLPKAELHLHIEGTLEPEMMFELATRNGVKLPYADVEAVRAAYRFDDLQSFLDLYYQGMNVLRTAADFHHLALAYFRRAHADGVAHIDVMFDPQGHLKRGIALATVFDGLLQAMADAQAEFGMTTALILSFLRDLPAEDAMAVLDEAAPWYERIEQSIDAYLVSDADAKKGIYAKFVEEGLLRGALKDTAVYLSSLSTNGIITRNEARGKLELNPLDGLDEPLTPRNMQIGTEDTPAPDTTIGGI